MDRVFANGQGIQRSISGQVILKTQKMFLDIFLFNTQHYKEWIKGKGVAPSSTPQCSSYWKLSLRIAFDYSRSTYDYDSHYYTVKNNVIHDTYNFGEVID